MNARLSALLSTSAITLAASLGACATGAAPEDGVVANSIDRHRIEVVQTGERMEVGVDSEAAMIAPTDAMEIDRFASSYLRWGAGPVIMSTPSGGDNAEAASLVAHQVRMSLVEAGVPYSAIAGAAYDGAGVENAPVVLSFSRYQARAPECAPLWRQDLAHQSDNQAYESFGCATQANLAAMIENPRDLITPRDMDGRDSGRRDTVMGAYRDGDTTHASRSQDERVTISNAVR